MSRIMYLRELRPESIFRLAGVSAANGIDRNYEVLVGIVGFSGADQRCIAGSNAACAMGYENGVTLCIVELPVCGVADLHACELFAILEGELGDGMNRILRRHTEWMPTGTATMKAAQRRIRLSTSEGTRIPPFPG
jgi:hypothetical protein